MGAGGHETTWEPEALSPAAGTGSPEDHDGPWLEACVQSAADRSNEGGENKRPWAN